MVGVLFLLLRPGLGGRGLPPEERPQVALPSPPAGDAPSSQATLAQECSPATPWTRSQRITLIVFGLTAAGWIGAAPLARALGITADIDSAVALAAIVALVGSGTIDWPDIEKRTQWGVLLLFGGGLALSEVMGASGASRFLANALTDALRSAPTVLVLLGVVSFVVFLTELVSNTASAALLVPIFLGVAAALGLSPLLLAAAIAVSASCAFMLPVATPPNAIIFGSGQIPQDVMMRCGLVINLLCIAVITLVALLVWA